VSTDQLACPNMVTMRMTPQTELFTFINGTITHDDEALTLLVLARKLGCLQALKQMVHEDSTKGASAITAKDWLYLKYRLRISVKKLKELFYAVRTTMLTETQKRGCKKIEQVYQYRDGLTHPDIKRAADIDEEAGALLGEQATAITLQEYISHILESPSLQQFLKWDVWGGLVAIIVSFDGVEITPTRSLELGLLGILNLSEFKTSPEAMTAIFAAESKEDPKSMQKTLKVIGHSILTRTTIAIVKHKVYFCRSLCSRTNAYTS